MAYQIKSCTVGGFSGFSACVPWSSNTQDHSGKDILAVGPTESDPWEGNIDPNLNCPTGTVQLHGTLQGSRTCPLPAGQEIFACVPTAVAQDPVQSKTFMRNIWQRVSSNAQQCPTTPDGLPLTQLCQYSTTVPNSSAYGWAASMTS